MKRTAILLIAGLISSPALAVEGEFGRPRRDADRGRIRRPRAGSGRERDEGHGRHAQGHAAQGR